MKDRKLYGDGGLIEQYYANEHALPHDMVYDGTIGKILDELLRASQTNPDSLNFDQLALLVYHPARLLRGIIDARIDSPEISDLAQLHLATSLVSSIYQSPFCAAPAIAHFKQAVGQNVLETEVFQRKDAKTWVASKPDRSLQSADSIFKITGDSNVLFISLAHGSILSGLDVFFRLIDKISRDGSIFHPVRFSRRKLGDPFPRLSSLEGEWLQDMANKRKVVVFEEDIFTGQTIRSAANYFFDQHGIGGVTRATNLDTRNQFSRFW